MRAKDLTTGDKVVIVDSVVKRRLRKCRVTGEPYVTAVYWEAEVLDPQATYTPRNEQYTWRGENIPKRLWTNGAKGVRVRLLTNCREGYADVYRPRTYRSGPADVYEVNGKGDEITIPARLVINTRAANKRLRKEGVR
jgi:hypothetical protein